MNKKFYFTKNKSDNKDLLVIDSPITTYSLFISLMRLTSSSWSFNNDITSRKEVYSIYDEKNVQKIRELLLGAKYTEENEKKNVKESVN